MKESQVEIDQTRNPLIRAPVKSSFICFFLIVTAQHQSTKRMYRVAVWSLRELYFKNSKLNSHYWVGSNFYFFPID